MTRIDFAWELGGNTGHVTTLHPIALALKARGLDIRFLQRDPHAGRDLDRADEIPREGAPVWIGPPTHANPLNFGEILQNFGYYDARSLGPLVDAWRERLRGAAAVVANVAPAAHIAARTLGIPSLEVSQGFHIPPPAFPSPPMRDWEPAPRARLEAADRAVLDAINTVLAAHGKSALDSIGGLFDGRAALLTYPELDIYPERGPADYYGVPFTVEGSATPEWPPGRGPRLLAYLYGYYDKLGPLVESLATANVPVLAFARGVPAEIAERHRTGSVKFSPAPLAVSKLLPQCDAVLCHASHQMTAQSLLAGKPLLMAPTQLEQFIIMRRVVRQGCGLGFAPDAARPDGAAAVNELVCNPKYRMAAQAFVRRYEGHRREAALETIVQRVLRDIGA